MSTPTAMTPDSQNKPQQTGEPLHLSDARLSFMFGKKFKHFGCPKSTSSIVLDR